MKIINKDDVFHYELKCEVIFDGNFNFPQPSIILPEEIYSYKVNTILDSRQVAPIIWGEHRYKYRLLDNEDRRIIRSAVTSIPDLMESYVLPQIFGQGEFFVSYIIINDISIGCIKISFIMGIIGLCVAAIGLADNAYDFYEKISQGKNGNITVKCELYVSEAQSLALLIRRITESEPSKLFEDDKICIKLRQKALKEVGYYKGKIDGVVGDKTLKAEYKYALSRNIDNRKIVSIYKSIADDLEKKSL